MPNNSLLSSACKLTTDDLNSLIAHAHRRIDQLNKELADLRVREQQHIEAALERQKLEEKNAFEVAVAKALECHRSEVEINQEKKVNWCINFSMYSSFICSCIVGLEGKFSFEYTLLISRLWAYAERHGLNPLNKEDCTSVIHDNRITVTKPVICSSTNSNVIGGY